MAAATALQLAKSAPTLLIDLGGDAAVMLGRPDIEVGLRRWLAAPDPPIDSLSRLEISVAPGLSLLAPGLPDEEPGDTSASAIVERARLLAQLADFEHRKVIVDIGTRRALGGGLGGELGGELGGQVLSLASRSTLVTRACQLSLLAAQRWPPPDDVVLVARQGRALRAGGVENAIGAPVVAQLRWDPSVARAVDNGRLAHRPPRSLRSLASLGPSASSAT